MTKLPVTGIEASRAGLAAQQAGKARDDNPFNQSHTILWDFWDAGFDKGLALEADKAREEAISQLRAS